MPVPAPLQPERAVTYRLVVVGEGGVVVKWASQRHTLDLPDDLEDGAIGARRGGVGEGGTGGSGKSRWGVRAAAVERQDR